MCQGGKPRRIKGEIWFSISMARRHEVEQFQARGRDRDHDRDVLPLFAGHTNGRKALKSGVALLASSLYEFSFHPWDCTVCGNRVDFGMKETRLESNCHGLAVVDLFPNFPRAPDPCLAKLSLKASQEKSN